MAGFRALNRGFKETLQRLFQFEARSTYNFTHLPFAEDSSTAVSTR